MSRLKDRWRKWILLWWCSVAESCLILCSPTDCSIQASPSLTRSVLHPTFLFSSGPQWVRWSSFTLGRGFCLIQSTDSDISLIQTHPHRHTCVTNYLGTVWPSQVSTHKTPSQPSRIALPTSLLKKNCYDPGPDETVLTLLSPSVTLSAREHLHTSSSPAHTHPSTPSSCSFLL